MMIMVNLHTQISAIRERSWKTVVVSARIILRPEKSFRQRQCCCKECNFLLTGPPFFLNSTMQKVFLTDIYSLMQIPDNRDLDKVTRL